MQQEKRIKTKILNSIQNQKFCWALSLYEIEGESYRNYIDDVFYHRQLTVHARLNAEKTIE